MHISANVHVHVQLNISIADALRTAKSVLTCEVSSFHGWFCIQLWTLDSIRILFIEVSIYFKSVFIETLRFHCINLYSI